MIFTEKFQKTLKTKNIVIVILVILIQLTSYCFHANVSYSLEKLSKA